MVTSKKTWRPLKPGDAVETRAANPRRCGTIKQAIAKQKWLVEFDDGSTGEYGSKALQRPPPTTTEPRTASNSSRPPRGTSTRAAAADAPCLEETDASSSQNEQEHHDLDDSDDEDDDVDDSDDEDDVALAVAANNLTLEHEEGDEELLSTPAPYAPADDSSIEEYPDSDDDDEEEEQETPAPPPEDYVMPMAGDTVDATGEPVEEDVHAHGLVDLEPEDVHKNKWAQYITDKAALLSEGWTVRKKGTGEGISIGASVRTKARNNRREGLVIGQIEGDAEGKKAWIVDFSNGEDEPEEMRPQKLTLLERNEEEYKWILVTDSDPEPDTTPEEYADAIGLCGFDFASTFKPPMREEPYNHPYLKLLQKMWPGGWKQQLRQLNSKAAAENATHSGDKNWRDIHPVSEQEWWVFIGILISAGPHGKGGGKLWEKPTEGYFGMTQKINYGPSGLNIMAQYRFRQIKGCFPWAFQDQSKAVEGEDEESYDPWNMVMLMVDGYNANRHAWIAASVRKTLDESMSAFRPRTSKTGGFPNISFILRKPEPLGTEFKTIACTVTGKKHCYYILLRMLRSLPPKKRHGDSFQAYHRALDYRQLLLPPRFCRDISKQLKPEIFLAFNETRNSRVWAAVAALVL
jgi:hypothetical protein